MSYEHGVKISEVSTSIVPPRRISAAFPVVFGTAPVHMVTQGETGPVNVPTLCYTYQEAVAAFGYSDDWGNYTLCDFFKTFFGLYNVGPIVVVNVFDPATHKATATDEAQTLDADDELTLDHPGLVVDPVVKDVTDTTTYVKDTDYTIDWITGVITRIDTGGINALDTLHITYDYGDPTAVVATDIIGGIDAQLVKTGLELVDSVFPMFRLVPGLIVAPGWSHETSVAAVMVSKAGNINTLFKAMAVIDVPESVTKYTDVPGYKNDNSLTDELAIVCWPKVSLGGEEYWLSSHIAGLIAQTDAANDGIPNKSPSNKNLQIDSAVNGGSEVWLEPGQGAYLNGQGIVTALNFVGGWKCWGNRTGCYPGVTDPKDAFIPVRRMFNWQEATIILTYWQKLDDPMTRRLIETIVDSVNIWLNGLAAREYILGGRLEFQEDENPVTDTMDGIIKFHLYNTPPVPAKEIDFIVEFDPSYLGTLFG